MRQPRDERGAATLLVLVMTTLLATFAVAISAAAGAVADHRSAQASADLSAVAAAQVHLAGGDGCGEAARVAVANESTLAQCVVHGSTVEVSVQVPLSTVVAVLSGQTHAVASATAGPVDDWS